MSDRPTFSILHTSARPDEWRKVYDAWLGSAARPQDVEYVLCVDPRWGFALPGPEVRSQPYGGPRGLPKDVVVVNTGRMCYVDGVNIAAAASTGKILIVNADDQYPPEPLRDSSVKYSSDAYWDDAIIHALFCHCHSQDVQAGKTCGDGPWIPYNHGFVGQFMTFGECVLRMSTGTPQECERNITVMPVVSRERYEKLGYVFYPEYESMYADNDLSEHAQQDGVFIEGPASPVFPHRHPFFTQAAEMDEAYRRQNRLEAYQKGEKILARRRAAKFADQPAPVPASYIPSVRTNKNIAIYLPGEQFTGTWVADKIQLIANLLHRYKNVWPALPYASNVHMVRHCCWLNMQELPEHPDYILWIDDDNILEVPQFDMLMKDLDDNPDIDGVVGWCWIFPDARISCGTLAPSGQVLSFDYKDMMAADVDLLPIQWSGFPVFLHRYRVVEKAGKFPFRAILGDNFSFGQSGEDTAFFANAIAGGCKFVCDRRVKVPHLKIGSPEPDWMMQHQVRKNLDEKPNPAVIDAPRGTLHKVFDKVRAVVGL